MLDQLVGLLLIGLGLQSPITAPVVKGDQTAQSQTSGSNSGSGHEDDTASERENVQETGTPDESAGTDETKHASGANGAFGQEKRVGRAELERRKEEIKRHVQTKLETRKSMRDALRLQLKEGKDVYRALFAGHREEFEKEIEQNHAEAVAQLREKKQEMEKKLAAFKDIQKKKKLESIQTKTSDLNTKLVENAKARIGKIASILDSVVTKKGETTGGGKDSTKFNSAVTAAQAAILAAQDALSVQSAKTYVVTITTESNAKNDVASTLKQLNADRKILNEAVVAARKAVSTAIRELATLRGEPVPEAVVK